MSNPTGKTTYDSTHLDKFLDSFANHDHGVRVTYKMMMAGKQVFWLQIGSLQAIAELYPNGGWEIFVCPTNSIAINENQRAILDLLERDAKRIQDRSSQGNQPEGGDTQ